MRALRKMFARLTYWLGTRKSEERLAAEIEDHIAALTAENIEAGLPPAEARRRAVLKFGGIEDTKENFRDQRGYPALENTVRDTRQALRRLRKSPVFTLTTVLTLALGIGATTSIFTLVHAVLLRSLAVSNPNDLYRLGRKTHCCVWGGYNQSDEFSIVSTELYRHFRDNTKGFAELAAFQAGDWPVGVRRASTGEAAHGYPAEFVSDNYFSMFGVSAYVGRTIGAKDDQASAPPVAMMSYRLWQQKYAMDASIIGSVFNLNDKPFTIIGITPPGFFGDTLRDSPPDFFLPLETEPLVHGDGSIYHRPNAHWLDLIGRIRPGVKPETLEAQMRIELKQWLRSHWGDMDDNARANFPQQTLYLSAGGAGITSMREQYERWLQILMIVSGFVLLIVCANVANLMLVRGMARRQQTSLSMALGARSSWLVRQALTESIVLSLLGGAAGLAFAFAGARLILRFAFAAQPGLAAVPISAAPSLPVLAFTFTVSVLTGIIFGIAPAWLATRVDPIEALRGANRSTSRADSLPRKMLVVLQAALSLVLLCTSGLLTSALHNLEYQNFGFEQEGRTIVNIDPQLAGYRAEQLTPFYTRLRNALGSVPGVAEVAVCNYSPMSGDTWNDGVYLDGHPAPGPKDDNSSSFLRVTNGYFGATGMRVLRGRAINDQDTANSKHVAVINEAFARHFFKNEDPMGKHFGRSESAAAREVEIVGVVKDARYLTYNLEQPIGPLFFLAEPQYSVYSHSELTEGDIRTHFLHDVVIAARPGVTLSDARIRQAIASVDPKIPISSIRTLREQVAGQFTQQRLIARLTSLFGILSLVLASVGIYGVTAYNAGSRTSEIGVRMALGADRGQVITLVLRGAFALILVGLAVGLALALATGRLLSSQLYGTSAYDPGVIAIAVVVLGVSALIASFVPAFRASLISPLEALRAE